MSSRLRDQWKIRLPVAGTILYLIYHLLIYLLTFFFIGILVSLSLHYYYSYLLSSSIESRSSRRRGSRDNSVVFIIIIKFVRLYFSLPKDSKILRFFRIFSLGTNLSDHILEMT